jgi:hypothetical protein
MAPDPNDPADVVRHLLGAPSPLVADIASAVSALETTSAEVAKLASAGVETKAVESTLSALGTQLAPVGAYGGELLAAYN